MSKIKKFNFGKNWLNFLNKLDSKQIEDSENYIKKILKIDNLEGKTFVDIGCGSGLSSLAARNLGANVTSFDSDKNAVQCTNKLKDTFYSGDKNWNVLNGSVLDDKFLLKLNNFDYVYSWGVLHHTGNMQVALENIIKLVKKNGILYIAIYNDQKLKSKYWYFIKKNYNRFPILRPFLIIFYGLCLTLPSIILKSILNIKQPRGMHPWYDLIDWLGGYPFEVSKPNDIINFYKLRNFILIKLINVGKKLGCNEYVFLKNSK